MFKGTMATKIWNFICNAFLSTSQSTNTSDRYAVIIYTQQNISNTAFREKIFYIVQVL
jgi:hypothetical protein